MKIQRAMTIWIYCMLFVVLFVLSKQLSCLNSCFFGKNDMPDSGITQPVELLKLFATKEIVLLMTTNQDMQICREAVAVVKSQALLLPS